VAVALFITHDAPRRLTQSLGYLIELLAAVPSIVFGLGPRGVGVPRPSPANTPTPTCTTSWPAPAASHRRGRDPYMVMVGGRHRLFNNHA
jgi:hypothetical protein